LLVTIATFIDSSRQILENDQLPRTGLVYAIRILAHCVEQPGTIGNLVDWDITVGSLAASFELAFLLPLVSSAPETETISADAKRVWKAAVSNSNEEQLRKLLSVVFARLRNILSDPGSRIL
jgi:hypothetical protein